jgi:hypothetical protein
MRLLVDHRTRYSFSEPQMRVVQLLRMTPRDHARQTVIDWRIDVDCDARLREGRDGYGNITTMLYVDGPVTAIELIVRGEVQTEESDGLLEGVAETLPPLFYLRPTLLTEADPAIEALATAARSQGDDRRALATALTAAVHDRIRIVSDRTPKTRTAAATLDDGWGNGRDAAHLLILAIIWVDLTRAIADQRIAGRNSSAVIQAMKMGGLALTLQPAVIRAQTPFALPQGWTQVMQRPFPAPAAAAGLRNWLLMSASLCVRIKSNRRRGRA